MSEVRLVSVSQPRNIEGVSTAEEFIAYAARVSNPANQINSSTSTKLLRYLAKNKHWSPFEMVHVCIEIKTTRDIGRQILRHRSFSFQEFSQRYAEVNDNFEFREARLQDSKNRQNSISIDRDSKLNETWLHLQDAVADMASTNYRRALDAGIAKEQARALLPEGMTKSTMYMSGTLRSWIHYCELRMANGTQKEHQDIAKACWKIIVAEFPSLTTILEPEGVTFHTINAGEIKPLDPSLLLGKPVEGVSKAKVFEWMSEWAKENLPPIPKNFKDIKLPDAVAPKGWDAQGGTPMAEAFNQSKKATWNPTGVSAPRWEHEE